MQFERNTLNCNVLTIFINVLKLKMGQLRYYIFKPFRLIKVSYSTFVELVKNHSRTSKIMTFFKSQYRETFKKYGNEKTVSLRVGIDYCYCLTICFI